LEYNIVPQYNNLSQFFFHFQNKFVSLPKVAQAVELRHETLSSNPSTAKKKKKERKKIKKS
jgi:hypothetical protein